MATTQLHPNALPGIPWSFSAKDEAIVASAGVVCFTSETIARPAFTNEAFARPTFSNETITRPAFTNESIDRC